MFADNTSLACTTAMVYDLEGILKNDPNSIVNQWSKHWFVTFNPTKNSINQWSKHWFVMFNPAKIV